MSRIVDLLSSLKASAVIGATTFASGLSMAIGLIPDNIGKVASLFGLIVTIMVMNIQRKNSILKDIEIEHARMSLEADRRNHARRLEDEK